MNTHPRHPSNGAMLTVHKLPTNHLILADNDVAKAARETGIEEVLVMIDRGAIVGVHTPPGDVEAFCSSDDWIFSTIRDAYARGINHALEQRLHPVAPSGWTLWADLKPGTIATSGDPDQEIALYAIGEPGYFRTVGGASFDSSNFGPDRAGHPFNHKAQQNREWPFFKVIRAGITREQMLAVVEAVEAGETIEAACVGLPEVT